MVRKISKRWGIIGIILSGLILLGIGVLYRYPSLWDSRLAERMRQKIDSIISLSSDDNFRPPRIIREDKEDGVSYHVYGTVVEIDHLYYEDEADPENMIEATNDWIMDVKLASGGTMPIHFSLDPTNGSLYEGNFILVFTDDLSEPFKVGDIVKLGLYGPSLYDSIGYDFLLPPIIILDKRS